VDLACIFLLFLVLIGLFISPVPLEITNTLWEIEHRTDMERSMIELLNITRINYCCYLDLQWFIDSIKSSLLLKYHTLDHVMVIRLPNSLFIRHRSP
jgi:hypothetical protein